MLVGAIEGRDPDDKQGEDDQDQKHGTNAVKHLGEVTSASRWLALTKSRSATNEGVVASGCHDHECFTTFYSG